MPRNADVMVICDAAEHSISKIMDGQPKPKFDRNAYQREYMRKRRQTEKRRQVK